MVDVLKIDQAYRLGATLLWQDRARLLGYFLLVSLPELATLLYSPNGRVGILIFSLFEHLSELLLLYVLAMRLFPPSRDALHDTRKAIFARLMVYGMFFWAFVVPPALVQQFLSQADPSAEPDALLFTFNVLLLGLGVAVWILFYFYFMPILVSVRRRDQILGVARSYSLTDILAAFRVNLAPFGYGMLLFALALSLSPDGRIPWVMSVSRVLFGVQKVLACYLGIAFGLTYMPEHLRVGVEIPALYREHVSERFASFLKMKNGIIIIAIAASVWSGITEYADTLTPAPSISVERIEPSDKRVRVYLDLRDPTYTFSGFDPSSFSLAGKTRSLLADNPKVLAPDGTEITSLDEISGKKELHVILEFETDRTTQEFQELRDLYLWYRKFLVTEIAK